MSNLVREDGQKIEVVKRESGERAYHLAAGKQPPVPHHTWATNRRLATGGGGRCVPSMFDSLEVQVPYPI